MNKTALNCFYNKITYKDKMEKTKMMNSDDNSSLIKTESKIY